MPLSGIPQNPENILEERRLIALIVAAQKSVGQDYVRKRNEIWDCLETRVKWATERKFANLASRAGIETADLMSESLLALDAAIGGYNASLRRSFYPYYMTCLLHRFLRLAERGGQLPLEELREETLQVDENSQFGNIFTERELVEAIFPKNVKDRNKKLLIFQLRRFHGWKYDRLADHFQQPQSTIHSWVEEVARRLRGELDL